MKSFIPPVHRSSRVPFRLRRDISSELPSPLAAPRRSFTNSPVTIAEVSLHPKARRPYLVAIVRPWIIRQRCWIEPAELPLDLVAHARGAELPGSGKLQWASLLAHPFSRWPLSLVLSLGELPSSLVCRTQTADLGDHDPSPSISSQLRYPSGPSREGHEGATLGTCVMRLDLSGSVGAPSGSHDFSPSNDWPCQRPRAPPARLPQPHSSAASCLGLTNHAVPPLRERMTQPA